MVSRARSCRRARWTTCCAQTGQPLDSVVLLDVDYSELTKRISGRRSCQDCGKVFNVFTSPVPEGETCPKTGQPHQLVQRSDDNEAAVAERLKVYDEKTKPLVDYYAQQGLLRAIDAEGERGRDHRAPERCAPHARRPGRRARASRAPRSVAAVAARIGLQGWRAPRGLRAVGR